jgi:hypothetical protein
MTNGGNFDEEAAIGNYWTDTISLLYRILLIWTQSGGAHDPGVRDRVC